MRYRRADVAGATYFFTVNLLNRKQTLLTDHIDTLRACIKTVKQRHPFHIDAMVILPDHLHAIWTLPPGDADFAKRWMLIKTAFSRALPKHENINQSRKSKRERGIWQRRYWEHLIRDELDYERHHVQHLEYWRNGDACEFTISLILLFIKSFYWSKRFQIFLSPGRGV